MTFFVGIHAGASNSSRSSLVFISGHPEQGGFKVEKIHDGLVARGAVGADDRIFEVLSRERNLAIIAVDLPLSVPPCLRCLRSFCPGKLACEDESVAYMLALNERLKGFGLRRKRSVNPQTQRVWDLEFRLMQLEATLGNSSTQPAFFLSPYLLQLVASHLNGDLRPRRTSHPLSKLM